MPNIQGQPTPVLFQHTAGSAPFFVIVDPAGVILADPAGVWIGGLAP